MKIRTSKNLSCSFALVLLIFTSCIDSPVAEYNPKSREEREIVSLLIRYQEAKNDHDIDGFLSLLHDNGTFAFQCGRMVSKTVLKDEFPGHWKAIDRDDAAVFPIVHECINGDYYTSGELNNPEISILGNRAVATTLYTHGISRVNLSFSMLRENDRWLITRTEWGDG